MTTVSNENNNFKLAFEEKNKIINTLDSKVQNIISENKSLKSSIKEKERNINELQSNLEDLITENNNLKSKVKELTKYMDRFLNWTKESKPADGYGAHLFHHLHHSWQMFSHLQKKQRRLKGK